MFRLFYRYKGLPKEIYVLFVARIVNSLGAFVHPLLAMILTAKLGMAEDEAGMLITFLLLTQLPISLLGGKLADRFGRRKLIIVFQMLGAAAYLACGLVPISNTSIYLIMLASYFYSFSYPAMDAITMDLTHAGQRKEAYALLYMGFNLGFVFGPMIGGLLFNEHLAWLFIGDALTTVISTILFAIFIKETLPKNKEQNEPLLEKYQEGSALQILWKRKIIIAFALIMMMLQFAYSQWAFELPLQLKALFGEAKGPGIYGVLASFNGLLVIVLTPLVTPLIRRLKALWATLAGGLLYAISFGMLIFVRALPMFYVSMFIMTFGEVIMTIDSSVFIAGMLPSSHRGRIDSIVNSIMGMGRVFSPMVIGWIIAAGSLGAGWMAVSGAAFVGCIGLFVLIRSKTGRKQIDIVSEQSISG